MLKLRVIQELRAEAERLRKQASLIDAFLQGVADERDGAASQVPIAEFAETPETIDPNATFASNVRSALKSFGRLTTTSREVADRLVEMGCPTEMNGKPIKERVANELFRMAAKGNQPIRKVRRGRYRYADTFEE